MYIASNHLPVDSATVMVKGTTNKTYTNAEGYFTLKDLLPGQVLVTSSANTQTKEIVLTKEILTQPVKIVLDKMPELTEVINVGYIRTKRSIFGRIWRWLTSIFR